MEAPLIGIPINTMTVTTGWGSSGKWTVDFLDAPTEGPPSPPDQGSGVGSSSGTADPNEEETTIPWARETSSTVYDYSRGVVGLVNGSTSATITVAANNDAHIALGETEVHDSPKYEIVLGGWGNTRSVLRYSN